MLLSFVESIKATNLYLSWESHGQNRRSPGPIRTFTNPENSQAESISFKITGTDLTNITISLVAPQLELGTIATEYSIGLVSGKEAKLNQIMNKTSDNSVSFSNIVGGLGYILARKKGYIWI